MNNSGQSTTYIIISLVIARSLRDKGVPAVFHWNQDAHQCQVQVFSVFGCGSATTTLVSLLLSFFQITCHYFIRYAFRNSIVVQVFS